MLCSSCLLLVLWRRLIKTPQKSEKTQSDQLEELNLEKVTDF